MPLIDMFYKRMLNFVYKCLTSESLLVNFIVRHGMTHGQMESAVGRNVLNCCLYGIIQTLKIFLRYNSSHVILIDTALRLNKT
jgi:hypothetical protein